MNYFFELKKKMLKKSEKGGVKNLLHLLFQLLLVLSCNIQLAFKSIVFCFEYINVNTFF